MIPRNATLTEHRPPLKRIDLNPPRPPAPPDPPEGMLARALRASENARIWRHLVQVAQASTGKANEEAP